MKITCPACGESREYPTVAENFEGEVKCEACCSPLKVIVKNGRLISAEEADPMHTESLDRGKLRILLNHWVQHNKEHSQEFREWAEKVKGLREAEIRDDMLEAAQEMDKANEPLLRALRRLEEKGG
jgi:TATA-binding protein-associated factor Taf7